MSHFTVTVCLSDEDGMLARAIEISKTDAAPQAFLREVIEQRLADALAPFDENAVGEPHRDYENGEPGEHWIIRSVRSGADSHAQLMARGAMALAQERVVERIPVTMRGREQGDQLALALEAVTEAAVGWARDAEQAATLPGHVTWADVARLHNERYSAEDGDAEMLLAEDGRAYTMSTYNPDSKWDWYAIGGRWTGYFPYKGKFARQVITGEPGLMTDQAKGGHCDGGPLSALDLAGLREAKATEARVLYGTYLKAIEGTPPARSWKYFREQVSEVGGATGYTVDQARDEYHSQPRVQKLEATEEFRGWFSQDPIEEFAIPEKLYVARRVAQAVPGYATLTADGRWMAHGDMGWFGMSNDEESSRIGYWEVANAYIESLPETAWIIAVDCHI
jgi:hypothetical protein